MQSKSSQMCTKQYTFTHKHPLDGPSSGTTQVSRYQKGKTNLDFTEARDSVLNNTRAKTCYPLTIHRNILQAVTRGREQYARYLTKRNTQNHSSVSYNK